MRILLATTGSLGDLHPYLAIGLGLQARGHRAVIATSEIYRSKVQNTGLEFAPMRPHLEFLSAAEMHRLLDPSRGPEMLIREILYPSVPAAFADVMKELPGCDVLVTHPIAFGAQIAAEKSGMPWISTVMAPLSLFSRFDPPVAPLPLLAKLRGLGPTVNGVILGLGRAKTKPWMKPVTQFRASLGMPPGKDPLFEGQHSPRRVLALFSPVMAAPQADWPPHVDTIGFPRYDRMEHGQGLDPALERFLDAGPEPVVFTLGSSAVLAADEFYERSLAAARSLGRRAVLLVGPNGVRDLGPDAFAAAYAPFSAIFPRAVCVVHQGGIGTCGQALAAGRPMLVMPYAYDQPDNAARLERLGVARVVGRKRYTARRAAEELERLLGDGRYAERAAELARVVAAERPVEMACDALERAANPN